MNPNTRTLTPREHQVMLLIGEGISNKTIASRMMISEHTVKAHLTSIFRKLGFSGRLQLALFARNTMTLEGVEAGNLLVLIDGPYPKPERS